MNFLKKMFGMDKPAETKKPAKKTVKKAAKKTAKKTGKKAPKKLTKKKKQCYTCSQELTTMKIDSITNMHESHPFVRKQNQEFELMELPYPVQALSLIHI